MWGWEGGVGWGLVSLGFWDFNAPVKRIRTLYDKKWERACVGGGGY